MSPANPQSQSGAEGPVVNHVADGDEFTVSRSRFGLRSRLTFVMVAVVAVIMAAFSAGILTTISGFLVARIDDQLVVISETAGPRLLTQAGLSRGLPNAPGNRPQANVRLTDLPQGTVAVVFDRDGEILRAWDLANGTEIEVDGTIALDLTKGTQHRSVDAGAAVTYSHHGKRILVTSPDQRRNGESMNADVKLIVAMPLDEVELTTSKLRIALLIGSLVAIGLAAALSSLLVGLGLRPLARVTAAAQRIAGGERGLRVGAHNPNTEVGQLALSFDTMLGELETAVHTAEQSEAKLRRFVADAAHELRTPLASVRGHAELMRRGMTDASSVEDVAKRIEDGTVRLGALVDQMLTLARLDALAPLERQHFSLIDSAAAAVADAEVRHPNHSFTLSAAADTSSAMNYSGDPLRIRQMIDNLLANAGRHTPAGTSVRLDIGEVDDARLGRCVRLIVADNGPGFPNEPGVDLFERFVRTDRSRTRDTGGSGLGLAIVRGVAEAHSGTARIVKTSANASVADGAAVEVLLPISTPITPDVNP